MTCSRDHELRFTVHESPDYFRMKVSIFNDDKRSDLIGETWVDLQNLIIPGGSQNDHWHVLQSRGKYAGEVRLEMTYYDTREQDETVIERRKGAAERAQGKVASPSTNSTLSGASTMSAASGLSGPRQLEKVKRRPLPTDPSGVCLPIVLRLGRFFARSTMATRVPIAGPSTDMSAKMPAAWLTLVWVSLDMMARTRSTSQAHGVYVCEQHGRCLGKEEARGRKER